MRAGCQMSYRIQLQHGLHLRLRQVVKIAFTIMVPWICQNNTYSSVPDRVVSSSRSCGSKATAAVSPLLPVQCARHCTEPATAEASSAEGMRERERLQVR